MYLLYSYHYYIQFSFVDITSFRFYNFRIEQDQNPLIFVSSVLMFFQFHFPFILLILIGSFSPFLFSGRLIPFSDMYGRSQHQYAIIRPEIISSFRIHLYILIFNRVIGDYMFASFQWTHEKQQRTQNSVWSHPYTIQYWSVHCGFSVSCLLCTCVWYLIVPYSHTNYKYKNQIKKEILHQSPMSSAWPKWPK